MDKGAANGACVAPPVFKAQGDGDGYAQVRAFATAHNMPFPAAWTEDEQCKAKAVTEDSLTPRAKDTKMCQ